MRNCLLFVWTMIDPIYYRLTRLQYVPDKHNQRTLFRVRLTKYKGRPIRLQDGTVINKNDVLIKIHFHNVKLLSALHPIKNDMKRALCAYKIVKASLPALARFIEERYGNCKVKGVIGISTLNRGANRLGFEIFPIRSRVYYNYKCLTFVLINYLSCKRAIQPPVYLFMSKQQLSTFNRELERHEM